MDLVFIVSINGLEKEEIIKTKVGRRMVQDSEPISLNETIMWYAEFSAGDPSFRRIDQTSVLVEEADQDTKWVRNVWEKKAYGIRYYVITEDEAKRLINTHPYRDIEDED